MDANYEHVDKLDVDRLEAGPELDALVAEKVMGYLRAEDPGGAFWSEKPGYIGKVFLPSQTIEHAWKVVEKLADKFMLSLDELHPKTKDGSERPDRWAARFIDTSPSSGGCWLSGECATAPLAICLAALKAVGV